MRRLLSGGRGLLGPLVGAAVALSVVAAMQAGAANFTGTNGDDTIVGTGDNDVVNGLSGHDRIDLVDGIDIGIGAAGSDTLIGGKGEDYLFGQSGNDTLFLDEETTGTSSFAFQDHGFGGSGDDTIWALDGKRDHIDCGDGFDTAQIDVVDLEEGCENLI